MAITISIQEVAGSATMTSSQVKTTLNGLSVKGQYFLKWTYSPTAHFNDAVTVTERVGGGSSYSIIKELTNLIPDTGYIIEADLYTDSISPSNLICIDSTSFATNSLGGEFKYTSRSASVITMLLTGLNPLDFEATVEMLWKKTSDSAWSTVETETISVGETKDMTHMFTGLTSTTSYDFRLNIYKGTGRSKVLIKTFDKTVSTLIYSGIIDEVTPSIKEVITVPLVNKGYIITELSADLPSGCTVHLFQSTDGSVYTDLGVLPNDLIGDIQSESEYVYYKLAVVDANNNRYNMTEPTRVRFTPFTRSIPTAGQTFNIMAVEISRLANALISLYKYLYIMYGGGVWEYEDLYNALVAKMGTLKSGVPVEGGEGSGWWLIHSLANVINGDDPIEPKEAGDIIYATDYVQLGLSVKTALQSIAD